MVEQDAEVAQAAHATLSALDSGEINAAIARLLGGDEPRTLEVAIQLAGPRHRLGNAGPAPVVQPSRRPGARAAVKSLGATIELADLTKLIALAVAPPPADQQSVAVEALKSACARLPRQGCTEQLAAALTTASAESQVRLLFQIAAIGGPEALRVVVTAAGTPTISCRKRQRVCWANG